MNRFDAEFRLDPHGPGSPICLQTIGDVVAHHARQRPQSTAFTCDGRSLTWRQFDDLANRLSRGLREAGVSGDARVAWWSRESLVYYALFVACARVGAVLVPIGCRVATPEVEYILDDAGVALLFVERDFVGPAGRLCIGSDFVGRVIDVDGAEFQRWTAGHPKLSTFESASASPDDAVVQFYTPSASGPPKGVVLAHRSFFAIGQGSLDAGLGWLDWRDDDVSLIGTPGCQAAGLWWAMQGLIAGVKSVALRRFQPAEVLRLMGIEGVTTLLAAPAAVSLLLAESQRGPVRQGSSDVVPAAFARLRRVVCNGSTRPDTVLRDTLLRDGLRALGCELVQLYGVPEPGHAATCWPAWAHGSQDPDRLVAGHPMPGVSIKVIGADGRSLPGGQVGELCLRTPQS